MATEQIKSAIAPCGLSCEKCFAHVDGAIRRFSIKLKERLGNFEDYAQRFEKLLDEPIFRKYDDFKQVLDYFASENCSGCRNEQCKLFKTCGVRPCHQKKQVDFCHECDAFPCDRTNFDRTLHKAWVQINEIIQKKGLEKFYEQSKDQSRYP